jgi:hypothetical protein
MSSPEKDTTQGMMTPYPSEKERALIACRYEQLGDIFTLKDDQEVRTYAFRYQHKELLEFFFQYEDYQKLDTSGQRYKSLVFEVKIYERFEMIAFGMTRCLLKQEGHAMFWNKQYGYDGFCRKEKVADLHTSSKLRFCRTQLTPLGNDVMDQYYLQWKHYAFESGAVGPLRIHSGPIHLLEENFRVSVLPTGALPEDGIVALERKKRVKEISDFQGGWGIAAVFLGCLISDILIGGPTFIFPVATVIGLFWGRTG